LALLPDTRLIFEDIQLETVKRVIGGKPVRVIPLERELIICARNFEEMILVEPHFRKGGGLEMGYSLRDPALLAEWLDLLKTSRKEEKHDYRRGKPRRLGRAGTPA
jgi:hypothetical protein